MSKLFIVLMLIGLSSYKSNGQSVTFNKHFNLTYPQTIFTGIEVTDSCYFVSGVFSPMGGRYHTFIAKFDTLGNELFHTIHLYAETWHPSLHTNKDGNLEAAARIHDGTGEHGAISTYDTNGNLIGNKLFDSPDGIGRPIMPSDMKQTVDTGHVVVSAITIANAFGPMCVTKLDPQGQVTWQVVRGTPSASNEQFSIISDTDSSYVMGYHHFNFGSTSGNPVVESHVERLDAAGNTLWHYQSPSTQQIYGVNDLVQTKDSGFVVASASRYEVITSNGSNAFYHHPYLYKLNQQGQLEWSRTFYSSQDDLMSFSKLLELEDSSIVAFGRIRRSSIVRYGQMVKVSPSGDSLWSREYEYLGSNNHEIYDAKRTLDGGFLIAGKIDGISSGSLIEGWLLKIDEYGCLVPGCHILNTTEPTLSEPIDLKLYPNPCEQYLNVYYPATKGGETLEWRLVDLQGKVVQYYERPDEGAMTYIFEVAQLPAGVYVLELRRDGEVIAVEEVVKR